MVHQITSSKKKTFQIWLILNFRLISSHGGHPWVSDFKHPNYQAGARALKKG